MPFAPKYSPAQKETYIKRVKRIRQAAEHRKFHCYIALACKENPCLTNKMVSNVIHNKKWGNADEVLTTVERVLNLPPLAVAA